MPPLPPPLPLSVAPVMTAAPMARRKPPQPRAGRSPPQLAAVNRHAVGIDVGAETHAGAGPPRDEAQPVRRVGADTIACEAVALASTGVSWLPRVALLATRGVAVLRVDPHQGQQITGRPKSDGHDCQGRPRRHPVGLLARAFRPTDQGCVLRRDWRARAMVRSDASQPLQPRHKALPQRHSQRPPVVRDVTEETGMASLRALLAGERVPVPVARLRHERCHHDEATIATALRGQWRDEPRCALAQAVALADRYPQPIGECDRQREAPLGTCAARCISSQGST